MIEFISLIGLCGAILLFLYFLQIEQSVKEGLARKSKGNNYTYQKIEPTRIRVCPVCNVTLSSKEYLICAMGSELGREKKRKVQIYGCNQCIPSKV